MVVRERKGRKKKDEIESHFPHLSCFSLESLCVHKVHIPTKMIFLSRMGHQEQEINYKLNGEQVMRPFLEQLLAFFTYHYFQAAPVTSSSFLSSFSFLVLSLSLPIPLFLSLQGHSQLSRRDLPCFLSYGGTKKKALSLTRNWTCSLALLKSE